MGRGSTDTYNSRLGYPPLELKVMCLCFQFLFIKGQFGITSTFIIISVSCTEKIINCGVNSRYFVNYTFKNTVVYLCLVILFQKC